MTDFRKNIFEFIVVCVGHYKEKFVSAETYEHILGLDKVLYGVCNHDKRFIAEAVSVGVVAKLEVVNIYDGDSAENRAVFQI